MLTELHEVTARIEKLSKEEHELIREVHPAVDKTKDSVEGGAEAISEEKKKLNAG